MTTTPTYPAGVEAPQPAQLSELLARGWPAPPAPAEVYAVLVRGQLDPVITYPRNEAGAVQAVNHAANLSLDGKVTEVRRSNGKIIGRWHQGRRIDLPDPMGAE